MTQNRCARMPFVRFRRRVLAGTAAALGMLLVAVAASTSDCWLEIEKSMVSAVTSCRVIRAAYACW